MIDHWIEISGAVLSLVYLYFSIKQSVLLWPIGLISSVFYIIVFFFSKLYAETGLQFYYIVVSIYGWYHWISGKPNQMEEEELPVSKVSATQIFQYTLSFALMYTALYVILKRYTDSPVPGWDSLATAGSLIATWMLAKKILENWLLWILVDSLSMGIYFYKHLYPTMVLFLVYTVLAYLGYKSWKKSV